MKAETAATLAVFGYLRNSDVFISGPNKTADETDLQGTQFLTRMSYSWQDQNHEYEYTLTLLDCDQDSERLELEIRSDSAIVRAEIKKEATEQYSISFGDNLGAKSDVIPWFKIDEDAQYIRDGYHQNADAGEEGPFSGIIELDGLRTVLNGHYNNEEVEYIVRIFD